MKTCFAFLFLFFTLNCYGNIKTGAEQLDRYLPLLKNKKVGLFVNHTSQVGNQHLVNVLLDQGIHITKLFVPEHGFRGECDGGQAIHNSLDLKTKIPIISLYGKKLKPSPHDLNNVDILVFDIQDVGVRFYTYIASLQKLMEAAVLNHKELIILDRPNPNGFYVDGPVLEKKFKSFTGMQPIPFVYGMTEGEYARMLVGEEWLDLKPKNKSHQLKLTIIPCLNYTHSSLYQLPIKPSPNLPDMQSIYWYASLGFLESTALSVGRGTEKPFQYVGHPVYDLPFTFIPKTKKRACHPPYVNQRCHGWNLSGSEKEILKKINGKIQLQFLLTAYQLFPDKKHFFAKSFNYAVGNDLLKKQIKSGLSEESIRKSWQPKLSQFLKIRRQYLLYSDF